MSARRDSTEDRFYSASEEEREDGRYVDRGRRDRASSSSSQVEPKNEASCAEMGVSGQNSASAAAVRPHRRKSQLGRDLQASISSLATIPPLKVPVPGEEGGEDALGALLDVAVKGNGAGSGTNSEEVGQASTSVNKYLLETTLTKVAEIETKLHTIQLSLAEEQGGGEIKRSKASLAVSASGRGTGGDQYEVLEGLLQVLNSVNQVSDMIAVKNEMFTLIEENCNLLCLQVKATQRDKEKEVQDLQGRIAGHKKTLEEKEKEVQSLRESVSEYRRILEEKEKVASKGRWEKSEKQRVLEDFNHLKDLYDKDRRRMEGLIEDAERRLRMMQLSYNSAVFSPSMGAASVPQPLHHKRNSVTSFSPLINSFQDRVHSNLSLSSSHENLPQGPHPSNSVDLHTNGTSNGGSDMIELVDMLTAENTKLRQIVNSSPASS
ncbi:hypothetical protein HOP50_01g06840 [Chloropicon primus]|uniref:Uncharacterized protein n=2 Tax=Chloropicon primus TaxID=1764295 RepID=A0A5B8MD79_9CHLO|nr:hypothetical protein A3770_01p06990 [Chloropicon primus]UPQ97393.1 hypothetical protein HOP50_01g06840 [Chloropicon primus]|eukprot:QDZ18181.1 hypothetical protein A3770_01p06990 [Chloropicon primus]